MEQERTEETEKSAESFGVGARQDQSGNAARQFQNVNVDDQPQRNIEEFHRQAPVMPRKQGNQQGSPFPPFPPVKSSQRNDERSNQTP